MLIKEFLTLECEKNGKYPKSLDEYLKMDDFYLYEKIKYYACMIRRSNDCL